MWLKLLIASVYSWKLLSSYKSMENVVSRVDIDWTTPFNMNELPYLCRSDNCTCGKMTTTSHW